MRTVIKQEASIGGRFVGCHRVDDGDANKMEQNGSSAESNLSLVLTPHSVTETPVAPLHTIPSSLSPPHYWHESRK